MKYALKRILQFMLTMVIVSFLAFLAFDLISGDAATALLGTEATEEALAALREAKRRCGQTLLLNPIPQNKWKYLRSVQAFSAVASMVPCSTRGELTEACRRLTLS